MSTSPPGWYPDPGSAGQYRWWDGNAWTAHVAPPVTGVPAGSALQSARSLSWMLLLVPFAAVPLIAHSVEVALVMLVTVAVVWAVVLPLQRRSQRRSSSFALAAGALWGGSVTAQPPNLGFGQSGRSLVAGWTPTYWRTVARGRLSIYPGLLAFDPRKPGVYRPTLRITPELVASVGAARYSFGGVLELHLRDGNRRRFVLSAPPGPLNDVLRQAGFPVS